MAGSVVRLGDDIAANPEAGRRSVHARRRARRAVRRSPQAARPARKADDVSVGCHRSKEKRGQPPCGKRSIAIRLPAMARRMRRTAFHLAVHRNPIAVVGMGNWQRPLGTGDRWHRPLPSAARNGSSLSTLFGVDRKNSLVDGNPTGGRRRSGWHRPQACAGTCRSDGSTHPGMRRRDLPYADRAVSRRAPVGHRMGMDPGRGCRPTSRSTNDCPGRCTTMWNTLPSMAGPQVPP